MWLYVGIDYYNAEIYLTRKWRNFTFISWI